MSDLDGVSYHARAELRRIRRESALRDAMFRKPSIWRRLLKWMGFR
jgi:hypothetical protein